MLVFTELAATLQTLLTQEAEAAARETGCLRRRRKFSGATFVQTVVLGWLHSPQAPLEELAEVAHDLGVSVSPQALDQRLTPAASRCLARVLTQALERLIGTEPLALPLLQRFSGVYVYDSTTVSLPAALADLFPGSGQGADGQRLAALKCQVELELQTGALDLQVEAGRHSDVHSALARRPLPAGALRLADRGYFDLGLLAEYTSQGVFWITRLPARTVIDGAGRRGALADWLQSCAGDRIDGAVQVGVEHPVRGRLLACRVPPAVAARRRQRLEKRAKKQGRQVSPERKALCAWNVCLTNLPPEWLRPAEAWVLLRARWQIELLFKLWKSHGGLAPTRGRRPARVLCEVYAKLVGMVVQHWVLLASCGSALVWSWPQAARRMRRQAVALGQALGAVAAVVAVLERLQRRLQRRCRLQRRQGHPSTYQLLEDPEQSDYRDYPRWEEADSPDSTELERPEETLAPAA
jgi:hypothetical protein